MPRRSIKIIVDVPETDMPDEFFAGFFAGAIMKRLQDKDIPKQSALANIKVVKIKIGATEYPIDETNEG